MDEEKVSRYSQLFNEIDVWTLLQLTLIIVFTATLAALASRVIPRLAELLPARFRMGALKSIPILRLFLVIVAIALIVPLVFNVNFRNFMLVLGTAGVAIGFALKDYVSSVVAGVVAVLEQPYRTGDWVRIGEQYGEVRSIGARSFLLQTPDDDTVTVPHLKLWDSHIVNSNDGDHTLLCVVEFFLAPNQHAAEVKSLLKEVARTSAWVHFDRPVKVVMQHKAWATVVKLKAYPCDVRRQFEFITDLSARGRDQLLDGGIEIVRVEQVAE